MEIDISKFKEELKKQSPQTYAKLYPESVEAEAEKIVDPIIQAFEALAKGTVENDRVLLELIQTVMNRLIQLEDKVDLLLMKTHGEN